MRISNPQPAAGNVEAGHGEYPIIGIVSPPCQHWFGTRVYVVQTSGIRRASSSPEVIEITPAILHSRFVIKPEYVHRNINSETIINDILEKAKNIFNDDHKM